ncbi:MAG TPA: N-acetyltransferase [Phycisphaerae bacterium]|nr:N-acetyltransferase [Phycisphaerae bacterium]HOL28301.1 N-acetyltransferase [Phycisphaerae bacterium]HPP22775.1 N-acetyltransferase [Phycisphaerae bacterium]HQA45302.1 N-acetyltransferase [Phycisphaerae bacterium]HXK87606.1 N-acetyltransferase [Phycisphaerae bacterium]
MTKIRLELPNDYPAVHKVNRQAFGRTNEADLVEVLRRNQACISLVAEREGAIVGHILFSPVSIQPRGRRLFHRSAAETSRPPFRPMGLGPLAVLPAYQRQGIGSELVRAGLDACRENGCGAVVVLGHPDFYPRFGFVPARTFLLSCEYDVPDPVFMALELHRGALGGAGGVVKYAPEFAGV